MEWGVPTTWDGVKQSRGCSIEQELAVHHLAGELNLQMWGQGGVGGNIIQSLPITHSVSHLLVFFRSPWKRP